MSDKWNLVIDINRCNGCYNCAIAAKDEYVDNSAAGYFSPHARHGQAAVDVRMIERGQYPALDVCYMPVMCNHCDDAPCLKAARDGAVTKREDGIVLIDPEKSRGQKQIAEACPYGAIAWNEERGVPQHWPFDAHLIDRGWKQPRAVEVCATGAISAHKQSDAAMRKMVEEQNLRVRNPEYGTQPRIYYRNLDRAEKAYIAGTVVKTVQGVVDCVEGAEVILRLDGASAANTKTDSFGDFRFEGLACDSGPYEIVVRQGVASAISAIPRLDASRFVGALTLSETT